MKNMIIAFATLISINAFACPNLTGHFICKDFDSGAEQDVTMSQSIVNGATVFKLVIVAGGETDAREYIADGVVRTMESPEYLNRTEKAFCEGNNLKVEVGGTLKKTNEVLTAVMTVNINADNNMYDNYIGSLGANAINFEEVCQRMP